MKTIKLNHKTCDTCEKPFTAKRSDAKFCSAACKQQPYNDRKAEEYKRYCRKHGIRYMEYSKKRKLTSCLHPASNSKQAVSVTDYQATVTEPLVNVINQRLAVTSQQLAVTDQQLPVINQGLSEPKQYLNGNNPDTIPSYTNLFNDYMEKLRKIDEEEDGKNIKEANERLEGIINKLIELHEKDAILLFSLKSVLSDLRIAEFSFGRIPEYPYKDFIKSLKQFLVDEIREVKKEGLRKFEFALETKIRINY